MNFNFGEQVIAQESASEREKRERKEAISRTTVYINAGGRGTRLESVFTKGTSGVTKALVEFAGKPIVQNHVDLIMELGFKNVIVGAGDHYAVAEYFQNNENEKVFVANTEIQEDTAGDLIKSVRELDNIGNNVLVENVDTVAYVEDIGEFILQHERSGADATIVLTTKTGVPNEGAFDVDNDGKVVYCGEAREGLYLAKPENWEGFKGSSTGIVLIKSQMLRDYDWKSGEGSLSLYRDLIPQIVKEGKMYAYNNKGNIFIDTGTPEKYRQVKRHEKNIFGAIDKKFKDQIS
ncbi:MAG: NUDIX hydrolase [uncultured bacterium]|nr:MAG: NUDIX hydrolase [uncultured bacterium]